MLDAIVFDFDGLILDTETPAYETAGEIFVEHGVELDRSWWESIIGVADHPHWTEVLEEAIGRPLDDREGVLERRRAAHHARIAEAHVQPGVVELLDAARAAGLGLAVASSSPEGWVAGHLEAHGLHEHFSFLSTREKVTRGKPAPDVYALAVESLGVDPGRAVALDDAPTGVEAARAAGLKVVGVPSGMTASLDFSAADLVVGSVADLSVPRLEALLA